MVVSRGRPLLIKVIFHTSEVTLFGLLALCLRVPQLVGWAQEWEAKLF